MFGRNAGGGRWRGKEAIAAIHHELLITGDSTVFHPASFCTGKFRLRIFIHLHRHAPECIASFDIYSNRINYSAAWLEGFRCCDHTPRFSANDSPRTIGGIDPHPSTRFPGDEIFRFTACFAASVFDRLPPPLPNRLPTSYLCGDREHAAGAVPAPACAARRLLSVGRTTTTRCPAAIVDSSFALNFHHCAVLARFFRQAFTHPHRLTNRRWWLRTPNDRRARLLFGAMGKKKRVFLRLRSDLTRRCFSFVGHRKLMATCFARL